jgi:urease accessory protein
LRVQKPLYPEGGEVCHAVIVHPPGGVVGGDELAITAGAGANAHALITTPGAAKWYKANDRISRQDVHLKADANGSLEWLPQETIFFNAAHVRLNHSVSLARDATYIGCEILCFGRTASGESFDQGRIEQCTSIRSDGRLVWFEQGGLSAASSSMNSPLGLAGKTVCATLIAVGKTLHSSVIAGLREEFSGMVAGSDMFGATQMKSVLVVRYLGNSSEAARRLMMRAWQRLRPELTGREAVVPRIWNT